MVDITKEQIEDIFSYWNSKKIVVHRNLGEGLSTEIKACIKKYAVETIKETIDLYAIILEIGVLENQRKYFWTYKWNLSEFLMRGVKKFDGQDASNYLRRQTIDAPTSIIIKRQ